MVLFVRREFMDVRQARRVYATHQLLVIVSIHGTPGMCTVLIGIIAFGMLLCLFTSEFLFQAILIEQERR